MKEGVYNFFLFFFQMFHSRCFIGFRQTCCAAKWKYKIIRIRHTMKWALVFMNITNLKQPLTDCIICLRWHFNKLLSSDINFHQDPTRRSRVCHWCSYNILTSSVIYYWTEARQLGIYLFYIIKNLKSFMRERKWPQL